MASAFGTEPVVAILDLHTAKADVTKAFTLADLDRELYCEQMPCIEIPGKPRSEYVCLLLKALEGLKQAGFLWQAKHTKFIKEYGFRQSDIDPCIFVLHKSAGIMIILVWVDDVSIAYSIKEMFADMAKFGLAGVFRGQGIGIFKAIISLSLFHEGRLFITDQFKDYNMKNGAIPK